MRNNLFSSDTIYISSLNNRNDLFKNISIDLIDKNLVKDDFSKNLIKREDNYPTGMDLSPIDKRLPNIAIPHTESIYVNTTRIIPIKLNNQIVFRNMINPEESIDVDFIFLILNNNSDNQVNLLSSIMDFINNTDKDELLDFFKLNNSLDIYNFLNLNF